MKFWLDNLEGFVSAIALIVSIIGAALGRSLAKKDMLKEQRADMNKEIYYSFFDLIFEFIELSSPEFADDICDSIFDKYQYDDSESLKARIDKSYIEITKRKQKLKLQKIKIETYASDEMKKTTEILEEVERINNNYYSLLDLYSEELKLAFDDDNETEIDDNKLRDETNHYEDNYYLSVDTIKKYMKVMQSQLIS